MTFAGSFGKVYSGTMEVDGIRTTVAIKTIKRKTEKNGEQFSHNCLCVQ